jgi:hypothetical protein
MAITAPPYEGKTRELTPAGNYVARCYRMIEVGTVETEFKGEKKTVKKVRIGWELPLELKVFKEEKGEQPIAIDKEYTMFMSEKANLRKDLESWRGKAFTDDEASNFDITKLLGQPCMINIIHQQGTKDPSKTYEKISSITPLPKGFTCPTQINPTFVLSYDAFDKAKFETLPSFITDLMKTSKEYKAMFDAKHFVQDVMQSSSNEVDDSDEALF